jgi:hypothetical protein
VPVDRGEVEAAAHRGPVEIEEVLLVREHHRDAVAGLQSEGAQRVRDAVGALVELAVGHRQVAVREDQRRLGAMLVRTRSEVHATFLARLRSGAQSCAPLAGRVG